MLWNGLSAAKGKKIVNPHDKLHYRMQALSFLLLLDSERVNPTHSKAPIYTDDAISEFERSCGAITKDNADFMVKEMLTLFKKCWTDGRGCDQGGSKQSVETSSLCVRVEMVLVTVKVLCKAGQYGPASTFMTEFESNIRDYSACLCTAAVLGKWAVNIHSTMKAGGEVGQALTECARALRSLSSDLEDRESSSVLEGCKLVVWAVDSSHSKELSGSTLLAWFSFLEEYQEQVLRIQKKVSLITG